MKLCWRLIVTVAVVAAWIGGMTFTDRVSAQHKKAGEAFKNVTTSTLKELSVDDFIASMGLISANLGLDCADCHPNAGTDKADFVIDTPRKVTTRRMVEMVAGINRTNFSGQQRVTCWTCHHGRVTPATTISLDAWYDVPNVAASIGTFVSILFSFAVYRPSSHRNLTSNGNLTPPTSR